MADYSGVALTDEQVAELLAGAKDRGRYERLVKSFMASEDKGIAWPLENGPFGDTSLNSIKIGFNGAIKRQDVKDQIRVLGTKESGQVALVRVA